MKSIRGKTVYFGDLAAGHFSGKFFLKIAGSGHDGSNGIGLKFVSCSVAEPIECQTHTHTQNTDIII